MAKKVGGSSIVGFNRICSSRENEKNEYNNSISKSVGSICASARPIYYGSRQRKYITK